MLRILDDIQSITSEEFDSIVADLPQWRKSIVSAYKHIEDRRESALSFHLLQQILDKQYAIREIRFNINEHGKPSLEAHPDIHFNMSHCRHAVACVVADHPVGVDIERLGRYKERIAQYTLSATELATIVSPPHDGMGHAAAADLQFTILWTKKEALLKLIGTGITDDLKNILHMYDGQVKFSTTINTAKQYVCTVAEWAE